MDSATAVALEVGSYVHPGIALLAAGIAFADAAAEGDGTGMAMAAAAIVTSKLPGGKLSGKADDITKHADDAVGAAKGTGKAGADFAVTPKGQAVPIPRGASGPTPTRAPGMKFEGGRGGHGLDNRTTGVRIMDGNANQGPRAVYMNRSGQTVNPATGRTVSKSDPAAHHYLTPW